MRVCVVLACCRYLCHQAHQPDNVKFFEESGITVFQCPIDGNKVRVARWRLQTLGSHVRMKRLTVCMLRMM